MTSKFEQLIEYVINDEEAKAKELFHDIVVEKSREIYENLMQEEEADLDEEELDEAAEEELDEAAEEELDETIGGDASDDLIDDVETEEQGMQMEDGEEVEFDSEESEEESGEDLEDRVVDLEDKLDELMAEFESLMGDEGKEEEHSDIDVELEPGEGGDALEMDDTAEFDSETELDESVSLQAAPKPVTAEEGGINKKSTTAFNSGAVGAVAKPVHASGTAEGGKHDAAGAYSNQTKELIGKVQNSVGGKKTMSPAPKPVTSQASGVNTKTPFPKG
jgi:hypothetical protein